MSAAAEPRARKGHRDPSRLVIPTIGLVVAGFCAASVAMLNDIRQDTWDRAITGEGNLRKALSQDIARSLETYDLSMQAVADGVAEPELPRLSPRLQDMVLYDRSALGRDLGALLVVDATGKVLRSSLPAAVGTDVAGRDFFVAQRDAADRGLFVGAPFRRGSEGEEVVGLSRRLHTPDGSFAGIVAGTIRLSYFRDLFSKADIGPHGAITLVRRDGICLMRMPSATSCFGRSFAASPNFRAYIAGGSALFTGTAANDGVRRIYDFGTVGDLPLVLSVALAEDDVFAPWRAKAMALAVALTTLCAAAAMLGFALSRQIRRTAAAERDSSASEDQYRLLADHALDIIMRLDRALRRSYVSPAVRAVLGYAPEDLVGSTPRGIIHPDDWSSVLNVIAAAQETGGSAEATYRLRHRDGHYLWMEGRYNSVPGDGGFIVLLRDVTQRKAAEERLAALNAELAAVASSDALTGLANRRRFDAALAEEAGRAARDGTPLSLLMLDVDRFKLYNDAFGHPEGDACLRAVADALLTVVRRPSDLVARYGGEEVAVLLPGTDAAGSLRVAERCRAAVAALKRPHPGNAACGGVVTVSLGCATLDAGDGAPADAAALVSLADARLYEAKRTGRDRVVAHGAVLPVLPLPPDEERRLAVLAHYDAGGATARSPRLDAIAEIAARLLGAPVGFVSLVGREEVTLAGCHGVEMRRFPRDDTYCAHTIQGDDPLVVPDTRADLRFTENALTRDGVGFYAGAPLVSPLEGRRLGALCVVDTEARAALDAHQRALLVDLARLAVEDLERRRLGLDRAAADSGSEAGTEAGPVAA
ncbi:diguanylate cyclase domain-containing protein [Lichenibacterium ramalinae]|uniref:diguanylate cyclase n=1 Tax=Lichenibacterium ramalinae TaxID=2316527 RepID=A0A4V1RI68_9HYPH|nr:diguanylate cyclase [Lichenibacterium ramalinae]RYB02539.1 diguanylate cyclase [Lichenibacterium ramalinae]